MSVYTQLFDDARRASEAARFPNRAPLIDALRKGRAPTSRERGSERNAFFSEFAEYFAAAGRALARDAKARSEFLEFGLGNVSTFFRLLPDLFTGEIWLATPRDGSDATLALPTETALAIIFAGLGYDLGALCGNKSLTRDAFDSGEGTLTELERDLLARDWRRGAAFFPDLASGGEEKIVKAPWKLRALSGGEEGDLNFALGYWEARGVRIGGRTFRWATLWDAERLFQERVDAESRRSSEPATRRGGNEGYEGSKTDFIVARDPSRRPLGEARAETSKVNPASGKAGASGVGEALLEVIVARGELPADFASALKPGDVITTDVPADRLFDVYIDGRLSFRGRPGVYRKETAVRLSELETDDE